MKDLPMDRQDKLLAAKARLDKAIRHVSKLAEDAYAEALACCAEFELDARDQLQDVASDLRIAEGHLISARAKAGRINSGGMTRGGGT